MAETLLVEIRTEELPPKALHSLSDAFADGLAQKLREADFLSADSRITPYATPRRLAVRITAVAERSPDKPFEVKGPPLAAALDKAGQPTKALEGFARKCGVPIERLQRAADAKGEYFVHRDIAAGSPLEAALAAQVAEVLRRLPVPKVMRWGSGDAEFVRPVHGLVMLHGRRVVPGEVMGQASGNKTRGHRFLGDGEVAIGSADSYEADLEARGRVIAGFAARRERIAAGLAAGLDGARALEDEALLDEVTALVEWPVVYEGGFEREFLEVPQECLILTMKQNQKYFPLLEAGSGRLLPRFRIVSNLETADPKNIVRGNERVLRARLADARFFYQQDRRTRLEERVPRLAQVVYHNRLGSQLERVQRLTRLAAGIARSLGADAQAAERAAYLCKADLLTDMVGEFPELQGIMGQYYARNDGEAEVVAKAIEAHYYPRFAADALPEGNVASAVALADKLDALTGFFGIGVQPTGDKDPFALRRHALGVLRILSERSLPLDLMELLEAARAGFPADTLAESVAVDLHEFFLERLRHYLRAGEFGADEVEAVVSQAPTRIDRVLPRLQAVQAFRRLPEAESLAAANKRIRNILRKTEVPEGDPDPALLQQAEEKALFEALGRLAPQVASLNANGDYARALSALAQVRTEVDTFFDKVLVMADEPLLRGNRLMLLRRLSELMNQVADISRLAA